METRNCWRGDNMSEYTPDTEEVRNGWVCCVFDSGGVWVSKAAYEDAQWNQRRAEAQFDRWLAAEKAKWQAEALREAASGIQVWEDAQWLRARLRARAYHIEKGED